MHVQNREAIIVVNVLALLTETICKQLNDARFISVLSSALKRKLTPIMGFHPLLRMKLKVLEVPFNQGKSSNSNLKATRNLADKSSTLNSEEKLSFYRGNTHRNFEMSGLMVKTMFLINYGIHGAPG